MSNCYLVCFTCYFHYQWEVICEEQGCLHAHPVQKDSEPTKLFAKPVKTCLCHSVCMETFTFVWCFAWTVCETWSLPLTLVCICHYINLKPITKDTGLLTKCSVIPSSNIPTSDKFHWWHSEEILGQEINLSDDVCKPYRDFMTTEFIGFHRGGTFTCRFTQTQMRFREIVLAVE